MPKFQNDLEESIFDKVVNQKISIGEVFGHGTNAVYYRIAGGLYWKVFTNFQPKFFINGLAGDSTAQKKEFIKQEYDPAIVISLLSSSIFWWWYTIGSDCWNLPLSYIKSFKTSPDIFDDDGLRSLGEDYLNDIKVNSNLRTRVQKQTGKVQTQSFVIQKSKPIIDEIDGVLARHYGFTAEELDFIQNYDIKFRVGASEGDEN